MTQPSELYTKYYCALSVCMLGFQTLDVLFWLCDFTAPVRLSVHHQPMFLAYSQTLADGSSFGGCTDYRKHHTFRLIAPPPCAPKLLPARPGYKGLRVVPDFNGSTPTHFSLSRPPGSRIHFLRPFLPSCLLCGTMNLIPASLNLRQFDAPEGTHPSTRLLSTCPARTRSITHSASYQDSNQAPRDSSAFWAISTST